MATESEKRIAACDEAFAAVERATDALDCYRQESGCACTGPSHKDSCPLWVLPV